MEIEAIKGRKSRHNKQKLKDFVRKHSFSKHCNNYFLQLPIFVNRLNVEKPKTLNDVIIGVLLSKKSRLFPVPCTGEYGCSGHALCSVELGRRSYIIYFILFCENILLEIF